MKEYGHVRSWEGITSVVLAMDLSSSSGRTGYVEFFVLVERQGPPGTWEAQPIACWRVGC